MKKKCKRKTKRELDFKKSTHLILRLKNNLPNLFCPKDTKLREGFYKTAEKYSIQIYDLVFNHTHVHLLAKIPSREAYVAFIRELTSRLVGYWSKKSRIKLRKIFASRPFTRVVTAVRLKFKLSSAANVDLHVVSSGNLSEVCSAQCFASKDQHVFLVKAPTMIH